MPDIYLDLKISYLWQIFVHKFNVTVRTDNLYRVRIPIQVHFNTILNSLF